MTESAIRDQERRLVLDYLNAATAPLYRRIQANDEEVKRLNEESRQLMSEIQSRLDDVANVTSAILLRAKEQP